jgi:tetratricopeptide (TPR) repeat protein
MRTSAMVSILLLSAAAVTPLQAHPGLHHDIEALNARLETAPDDPRLHLERAVYYRLNGEYDRALADLDLVARTSPAEQGLLLERGLTLSAAGRDRDALRALDAELKGAAGDARALGERARVNARLGNGKAAIADYGAAIAIAPDLDLYLERGGLQEKAGRLDAAAAGYRDGLARLGGAVLLREGLIRVELRRGDGRAALAAIDEGMAHAAVKTGWMLRRSEVLDTLHQPEAARAGREQALQEIDQVLEQRDSGIHRVSRARVLAALGRKDDARRELEQVLARTPNYDEARDLLRGLDSPSEVVRGRR